MNRKLIAIDIDRTLLSSSHTVSPATRQYLHQLVAAGHIVVIATGRILSSARAIKEELELDISYVGCNGATLYDHVNRRIVADALDGATVARVLDVFQKHNIYHHYYTEDTIYANRLEHVAARFKAYNDGAKIKHIKEVIIAPDLRQTLDGNIVYKFGMFDDGTFDLAAVVADLEKIDGVFLVYSNIGLLDVVKAGTSKWTAIQHLMDIHGVAQADVIAFGDSPNDIDMIKNAAVGVAMGNAVESVKAVADYQTLTSDEDGVRVFLEEYFDKHE